MSKRTLVAFAAMLIALTLHSVTVWGQTDPPTRRDLQRNIEDITQLDPEIERYLPRWRILEADLKIKIAQYFKLEGIAVSEADSMIATASFPDPQTAEQDLLSLRVGDSPNAILSGAEKIRGALGEVIYRQILNRDYQHAVIEPATPITANVRDRIPNVMQPTNARQFVAISAFRQAVQVGKTGARVEHTLGNDEIGYHFWTSGQGKATLNYPIIPLDNPELRAVGVPDIFTINLGIAYRMKFGAPGNTFLEDLISPRKLNGAIGSKAVAHLEYRLPAVNDFGFALHTEVPLSKQSDVQEVRADNSIARVNEIVTRDRQRDTAQVAYFLRTIAQGSVFWENWLNDYEHFFRISLGASYQEVARTGITIADLNGNPRLVRYNENVVGEGVRMLNLIHPTEFEDWVFAKIEYLNQSGFPFGLSAQLANRNLLLGGFIPVIKNWLFLEAKYSTPVLRDEPAPWEYNSFFMISPIIRFELD